MPASLPENVYVHDAGDKLVLSSQDEAALKQVVEGMRKEGARGIGAPVKVGSKWVASLEHPFDGAVHGGKNRVGIGFLRRPGCSRTDPAERIRPAIGVG